MNVKLTRGLAAAAVSAAMMLGAAVPAMAASAEKTVAYNVTYNQNGVGTAPTEVLTYDVTNVSVSGSSAYSGTQFPTLTVGSATFNDGDKGTAQAIMVTVPKYDTVGVYTYSLTPKWNAGKGATDAGVNYSEIDTLTAVVTVTQGTDGLKSDIKFHQGQAKDEDGNYITANKSDKDSFTYNTGNLSLKKTVSGNMGDTSKYFKFSVKLNKQDDKTYADSYEVTTQGSDPRNLGTVKVGETATFYLKNDETIKIAGLPAGVTYSVTEDADGYTSTELKAPEGYTAGDKAIASKDNDFVGYNNELSQGVDTGVILNNAPYIAILGGAAVVTIYLVNKRRHSDMD